MADLPWLTILGVLPLVGAAVIAALPAGRDLLAKQPKLGVAAAFYLLYVVGIVALAIVPGLQEGSVVGALWRGALFGFLAYATYDLTNLSTIRDWPWQLSLIDMTWGTILNSVVAVAGYYGGRWLGL